RAARGRAPRRARGPGPPRRWWPPASRSPRSAGCPRGRARWPARRPRSKSWPSGAAPQGEPEREAAALARRALHGDVAAVRLGHVAHERQAHAAAAAALRVARAHAVELLEDPRVL